MNKSLSRTEIAVLPVLIVLGSLCSFPAAGLASGLSVTYYHNDALGSPVAATNEAGNVIWREAYRPFGARTLNESAAADNTTGFTGHRQNDATGLVYMGARYYDPVVGRFMAIDPVGVSVQSIHSFNRFAYGNNNPETFSDPDGRYAEVRLYGSRRSGGQVDIVLPVKFTGPNGGSANFRKRFKRAVEAAWNNKKVGKFYVRIQVVERARGRFNEIHVGVSDERAHVEGARIARVYVGDDEGVLAHEVGHLLGLMDRYTDIRNEKGKTIGSTPHTKDIDGVYEGTFEGNLMADSKGEIDERNIDELLRVARRNRWFK